ncbi:transcription modulator YdgT [Enterobacter sp. Cy-643]|uniref:transcription modulator YdgT n=1 Tax=Enterobacter sp. Cy-643 TaxID=2608346 RepID=UPI001421EEE7|nr:transcription modulator YdgT [Enterobacter sp. Cy-643]NIF32064.1 transcription modulator YdgT [Enterobacter sp. Cy-643]
MENATSLSALDYLMKFRKISSQENLEKLFDHLNYTLTDSQEIMNMYRAADHRRAELASGGRLFDLGCVPKTVWRYVV